MLGRGVVIAGAIPSRMLVLAAEPRVPGWLAITLCAITLLVIAWHVVSVHRSNMPRVRRRLRICNGVLMMFIATLLAYALGIAVVPEQPRLAPTESKVFVIVWIMIVGLLAIVVMLAVLDALLTVNNAAAARRRLHEQVPHQRLKTPSSASTKAKEAGRE